MMLFHTMMRGGSPAAVDSTAPTLSSPVGTTTGTTTATVGATTNEGNGTMYVSVTTSATPPSASALKAGTGAAYASSQSISSTGAKTFSATGLAASTTYYAHLIHTDAAANDSSISTSASFTTDAASGTTLTGDLFSENDWKTGYNDAAASISTLPHVVLNDSDTPNSTRLQSYLQQRWNEYDLSNTCKFSLSVDQFDATKRSLNFHSLTPDIQGTLKKTITGNRRRIYMACEMSFDALYDFNNNKLLRLVCRDGTNPFVDFYVSIGAGPASGTQDCDFIGLFIQGAGGQSGNGTAQSGTGTGGDPNCVQQLSPHSVTRGTKYILEMMLYANSPGNADGEAAAWWGPSGGSMSQLWSVAGKTFCPNTGIQHYFTEARVHMEETNGAGYANESIWRVHQIAYSTTRMTG